MKYLLDTNVLIGMLRGENGIREAILSAGFENCAVSDLSLGELYVGAYKRGYREDIEELSFIEDHFQLISTTGTPELYGKLRAGMESSGERIDDIDLLIGCTSIANKLIMVTHNVRHFSRIPGIVIEDWEKPTVQP